MKSKGLGRAYLSTLSYLTKKFFKWSLITALCTEAYMYSADRMAEDKHYAQTYKTCLEDALKTEEQFFNIKFKQKPKLYLSFNKSRSALIKQNLKEHDTLENVLSFPLTYITTTLAVISYNESISRFLNVPMMKAFVLGNSIYSGPFKAKPDEREVMLHELMHIYVNQTDHEFVKPLGKVTPDVIRNTRMTVDEGLATYAAIRIGKAERNTNAFLLEMELTKWYKKCSQKGYGLNNKFCQYAVGYKFVKDVANLMGDKKAVHVIVNNPPTLPAEIIRPKLYVKMLE